MPSATENDIEKLEKRLRDRREELRWIIHDILVESKRQDYIDLAGQVHDAGEESIANVFVDLDLSALRREVEEIRDVEAALERISDATYGQCIDCENDIELTRLEAYPTAKRCIVCQNHHEGSKRGGRDVTPSL